MEYFEKLKSVLKNLQADIDKVEGFKPLRDVSSDILSFVDGGNANIVRTPSWCVQFVRLFCVTYKYKKRINTLKEEFFVFVNLEDNVYRPKLFGADYNLPDIALDDSFLSLKSFEVEPEQTASLYRRLCELQFAKKQSGVVVLDGDLEAKYPYEKEHLDGFEKALGVCKTTRKRKKSSSVIEQLFASDPGGSWIFGDNPFFVKFHNLAKHIFRIDAKNVDPAVLKEYSADPSFLGYPYPLVEADRHARVSNREKEYFRLQLNLSDSFLALESHDILDSMG